MACHQPRDGVDEAEMNEYPYQLPPGDSETIISGEPAEIQLVHEHIFWLATWHTNSGERFVRPTLTTNGVIVAEEICNS